VGDAEQGLDPDDYRVTYDRCMYNLSTSSDFQLDFHPEMPGVFLATAGSGHGYKFDSVLGRIVLEAQWNPERSVDATVFLRSVPHGRLASPASPIADAPSVSNVSNRRLAERVAGPYTPRPQGAECR
jgi:hypothetical protein